MPEPLSDADLLALCARVEAQAASRRRPGALQDAAALAAAVRRLLAEKAALEAELAQARGALTPAASPRWPG